RILNDDLLTVSINDVAVTEGNIGAKTMSFTVSLSGPARVPITVDFETADGTATAADHDYVPQLGHLRFERGDTTKPVDISLNGDATSEPDETFFVNLRNASNAIIVRARGVGTILDDDKSPACSALSV